MRCDRLRDGSIEVEFESSADAARALMATTFCFSKRDASGKREVSLPITVAPHRTKNYTKGVINCFELSETSDDEITDGLATSGVAEAKRVYVKRKGNLIPTNSIILTFDDTELPSHVTVGYTRVRVRPYIPNPMRCFKCQRFGHTRQHCRNRPACAKCASTDHLDEDCQSESYHCANCGDGQEPHTSYDRQCPSFKKEREINTIKAENNISFREARDRYNQTHPTVSYAQKAKAPVSSATRLEQMTAIQLVGLLKSFGLSVVAAGAVPATTAPTAPPLAAALVPSSPSPSTSNRGGGSAASASGDDGWIQVQRRRTTGHRTSSPPQSALPGPSGTAAPTGRRSPVRETAVMAALRRNDEEKRARDARRARLVERARETRRSPGTDPSPGSGRGAAASAPSSGDGPAERSPATECPAGNPSPMGPPAPPPPPPLRPREPPPPLPAGSPSGKRLPSTPRSTPRSLEPPPAPARPGKRGLVWSGSPSEGGTPRTRHKPQTHPTAGRSSSADGRLHADPSHPRIHFGDGSAQF